MSSRARRQGLLGAAEELPVDGVGEASFQASHGFLVAFAGGAFALVASWLVEDMTKRRHIPAQGAQEVTHLFLTLTERPHSD